MNGQEGGCLCGKIRYTLKAEPLATALCHCTNCQRQGGAAFSVNLLFAKAQVDVTGTLTEFVDHSDKGDPVGRNFCGACGSPIYSALSTMPGMIAIKAGTLDDTSGVKPQLQVWCASAQSWLTPDPALPAFPKDPPRG